jgi:hypothetical protein
MHGKIIVLLLTAAASHGICAGEIYRCTTANGDVMYTNLACPAKSQVQHVASYVPEKDSPPPVRDLAAEAAALSAQQAREAAEQAQAAAYQAAQAAYRQVEYDAENDARGYDNADYPLWFAPYAFSSSRLHDGHHHGREVVHHRHDGGRPGSPTPMPMPPHRPMSPVTVHTVARLR